MIPTATELLVRQERRQARRERWRLLRRRPGFIVGSFILLVWVVCALGGAAIDLEPQVKPLLHAIPA